MNSSYIGKVIDNYRIVQHLGVGGMGVVFKAVHIKLDKVVALKMIAPGLAMNKRFIQRFETEAKSLAKLEDPNIVRIYDLRQENDQWFIVMEFIEGITLTEKIKREGALPWQDGTPILHQILTSIGHAHKAGIIHRDIKPNNIMLINGGQIKITDFGLAKDQQSAAHTMTITAGGTLYYMSPEHVKGFAYTDHRSDIYSIGMTAYEMFTGKVPFDDAATDFDIREKIVRREFPALRKFKPDIPRELDAIIMKAIAKQPDKRYQRAEEMLADVKALQRDYLAEVATGKKSTRKSARKYFRYAMTALFSAMVILMAVLLYKTAFVADNNGQAGGVAVKEDSTRVVEMETTESPVDKENLIAAETTIEHARPTEQDRPPARQITAIAGVNKTETADRAPGTAAVSIQSEPNGATIWLEDRIIGRTPFTLSRIETGRHAFILKKEGFRDQPYVFTVEAGGVNDFTVSLSPVMAPATIMSEPEGAAVFIDGKDLTGKKTPVAIDSMAVGNHALRISKHGYQDYQTEIEIAADENNVFQVDLKQLFGTLVVFVKPWGSIYIDGDLKRESTKIKYQVDLPVDNYEILVVHPTMGRYKKQIDLPADQIFEITVDFNRSYAIKMITYDANKQAIAAQVTVDGESVQVQTPTVLNLHTGLHRIVFKTDRYHLNKEILVDESTPKILEFVLD